MISFLVYILNISWYFHKQRRPRGVSSTPFLQPSSLSNTAAASGMIPALGSPLKRAGGPAFESRRGPLLFFRSRGAGGPQRQPS